MPHVLSSLERVSVGIRPEPLHQSIAARPSESCAGLLFGNGFTAVRSHDTCHLNTHTAQRRAGLELWLENHCLERWGLVGLTYITEVKESQMESSDMPCQSVIEKHPKHEKLFVKS